MHWQDRLCPYCHTTTGVCKDDCSFQERLADHKAKNSDEEIILPMGINKDQMMTVEEFLFISSLD